jgi:hypothetical protein
MIVAITPTGDRPQTFKLCLKWMESQTLKPDRWVIVDDGKFSLDTTNLPSYALYLRRHPTPSDPKFTLCLNMKEAFKVAVGDIQLVIEDDEYYAPTYIEKMVRYLQTYEVVGLGRSKYYHLPSKGYKRHMSLNMTCLSRTAWRDSFSSTVQSILNGDSFFDVKLWRMLSPNRNVIYDASNLKEVERVTENGKGIVFDDGDSDVLCLGIKGLPGRAGIGQGHLHRFYTQHDNDNFDVLKRWIPKAFCEYIAL